MFYQKCNLLVHHLPILDGKNIAKNINTNWNDDNKLVINHINR
jgi:hypothetical protein